MDWYLYALAIVAGYLLGNFSSGTVVSRIFGLDDIRRHGSGNPGTTNVMRTLGFLPALLTFLGDALKAVIAVCVGLMLADRAGGMLGGLFCVAGHNWPVFMHFKGGRGIASSFGVVLVLSPYMALALFCVQIVVLLLTKYMSVASIISAALYAVLSVIYYPGDWYRMGFAMLLCALAIYSHRSNIKRLIAGSENKLDLSKLPHAKAK